MGNCATVSVRAVSVAPDLDINGCNKTTGETWCARTQKCQKEWENPCNPIEPVGGGTVVYTDTTPAPSTPATGTCDGLNRNGEFDVSCLMDPKNQIMLIAAIAIVGGAIFLATRGS
jgi:hypothetical protein